MPSLENTTTLVNGDVFDPQVVSDMINAKVEAKAVMTGYVKVDNTLQGVPGSTVTIPKWGYIGEAVDLVEGQAIDATKMAFTTAEYGIKKIGKGVMLTDEAQLSGYGNPTGTATGQIAMSISEKLDNDRVAVLCESPNIYDATAGVIGYDAVVDATDMFNEEEDSRKVLLIHPKQKTQLRKDPNFIDKNKFGGEVMVTGAIGKFGGCEVVVSKKVPMHKTFYKVGISSDTLVTSHNIGEIKATLPFIKEGDYVKQVSTPAYFNPIIKLDNDNETEDDMSAVTYFLKRGNLVEHERVTGIGDKIVCTAFGMPSLTNDSKVVILRTKATK